MEDFIYGNIEQNFVIYSDLIFPLAYGFSISLKVGNISTPIMASKGRTMPYIASYPYKLIFDLFEIKCAVGKLNGELIILDLNNR
jgi:hypothetical protein